MNASTPFLILIGIAVVTLAFLAIDLAIYDILDWWKRRKEDQQ